MAEKMKVAVVREFEKPLEIEQLDVPYVPSGQVLVKVVAFGVCHTDLHAAESLAAHGIQLCPAYRMIADCLLTPHGASACPMHLERITPRMGSCSDAVALACSASISSDSGGCSWRPKLIPQ
jgi:hypothetical protein